jgi:hypothetical protein
MEIPTAQGEQISVCVQHWGAAPWLAILVPLMAPFIKSALSS